MLYTKPIEKITFQDVLDFCSERYKENINLDYKQEIESSLAKTVAAMANTWGGLIIIGVADEDSMPKLPVVGLEFREHLQEQINNIILGNITPPLFPEIQICKSDDESKALVVVRISQSNISPHAIKGGTKVYLRTNTSNEPEELATVDRVLWLTDRRKKSVNLKESFYMASNERFTNLARKKDLSTATGEAIFSIGPLYPFNTLTTNDELTEVKLVEIKESGWGTNFPTNLHHGHFLPFQFGTYSFNFDKNSKYFCYEEVNQYGFFYHKEDFVRSEGNGDDIQHYIRLHNILIRLDLFLGSMHRFYNKLGYWGLLELKVDLKNLEGVNFIDLPAPNGYHKIEEIKQSVDNTLKFSKQISYTDIKNERVKLVVDLITEIGWALGFENINPEIVRKLIEDAKRG